ncbi:Glycerol-3-phosphate acyltransferase [uncultured Alphaproteobacteria bacterium]|jgi:glycerol-3-phosphate acyltransferase PlsY|uniref:Glycerol-3-phosphate acyltransferase n=1 Tax=uncultured Alphaproteobacteria bacterium TaxID=91750 RepID=A0A212JA96_9PROT|nr:Glycerol-3-phosphate acyltransferase [uncultured Alphaproteobacteria bacterium]
MTTSALALILAAVGGYLLGSIPFGLVLTRMAGLGDLRAIGSGNIGATNVLRTGRKGLALATLLLDSGKGAIAAIAAWLLWDSQAALVAGLFAVLGHNFPVWLNMKGGKGVATTLGVLLATSPLTGLAACLIWLGMAFAFHYSSLSALVALAVAPFVALALGQGGHAVVFGVLAILAIVRHHANVKRLLAGTEPRIDLGKKFRKS